MSLYREMSKFNMMTTYNATMYNLRKLPGLKRVITTEVFGSTKVMRLVSIIGVLRKIFLPLISQTIYLMFIYFMSLESMNHVGSTAFLMDLIIFTVTFGVFFNNMILVPTREKYFAIHLLRVDARKYAHYCLMNKSIEVIVSSTVILSILSLVIHIPLYYSLIYASFYFFTKLLSTYLLGKYYEKKGISLVSVIPYTITIGVLSLGIAVGANYLMISHALVVPEWIVAVVAVLFALLTPMIYVVVFKQRFFYAYYKTQVTKEILFGNANAAAKAQHDYVAKTIKYDSKLQTKKTGYTMFNDLFEMRHKKVMFETSIRISLILAALFSVAVASVYFLPLYKMQISEMVKTLVGYIFLIMLYINRGAKITQVMFINCDVSMLRYRFYRKPTVVIQMFTRRLKTLIKINALPGFIISVGFVALLYLTNHQTEMFHLIILFLLINVLSVFFSVHWLAMYYLLQPYDETFQVKSIVYLLVTGGGYGFFFVAGKNLLMLSQYVLITLIFCLVYCVIALLLVYRFAPKTFRIR